MDYEFGTRKNVTYSPTSKKHKFSKLLDFKVIYFYFKNYTRLILNISLKVTYNSKFYIKKV